LSQFSISVEINIGATGVFRSIPAMWLIDKDGNLADKNARRGLEEKIEKLLAAPSSGSETAPPKAD
jgi:hypothetical protein